MPDFVAWRIRFDDGRIYTDRMWLSFKPEKRTRLLTQAKGTYGG